MSRSHFLSSWLPCLHLWSQKHGFVCHWQLRFWSLWVFAKHLTKNLRSKLWRVFSCARNPRWVVMLALVIVHLCLKVIIRSSLEVLNFKQISEEHLTITLSQRSTIYKRQHDLLNWLSSARAYPFKILNASFLWDVLQIPSLDGHVLTHSKMTTVPLTIICNIRKSTFELCKQYNGGLMTS